ncbi:toys are us [Anopheles darlingi]|uniref:Toys are us n=1 Tax=Anopheles darlingi TaxID=43151 RepID=W5JKK4_ANODA|nr:programmed cell death protein 2-like [Anopheles darlingi]ETN63405.1 toys are us [Anopheles darlingi]
MAKQKSLILLGYDDEPILEKDKPLLSYTTNKIGGHADWPAGAIDVPPCALCGQQRPLIVQIYAPLEDSQFHRTLYVFACLNAPCSTQSQSWSCIRVQSLEKSSPGVEVAEAGTVKPVAKAESTTISWCSGADDWGDDGDPEPSDTSTFIRVDTSSIGAVAEQLLNEENGNVIQYEKVSDEDDESNSMETDPLPGFGNLHVDERNANACGDDRPMVGATGGELIDNLYTAKASAEIEGPETAEVVVVDTPVALKRDLIALLKQPQIVPRDIEDVTLQPLYISVDEERSSAPIVSDHVRRLLDEYQRYEEVATSPDSPAESASASGGKTLGTQEQELYEKGVPMHGDLMFHSFMTKLQENPGQVLRYSRNALPLLIAPLKEINVPPHCQYCKCEMICEVQLLPTVIEKLRFAANGERTPIDFGNVLVWTCIKSCWDTPDKMRQELVLVQAES